MTVTLPRPGEAGSELPETPYVGLVPYGEGDAPFFFGRERERKIVTANIRAARLTLLYGPSGVGKTSLLHAGVVSNLRQLAGPALTVAVFSSWSDDPLPALTDQIRRAVSEAVGEDVEAPAEGTPLAETLGGWTGRVRRILVVLDQFEDYFLYHPDEDGDGTFFVEFPCAVNEPNLRVNFLLSIREDALAKLDRFEGRIPNLFGNYIRIDHLTSADARAAVEGPIGEYNRRQPEGAEPYATEPALVDSVVDAAASGRLALAAAGNGALAEEAASGRVETPFLQLVMERLWRATVRAGSHRLTMQTLRELGGAQRIVENHLLEALGSLDPTEQAAAADLFRFLVSRSKTKIAHSASDLAEWTKRPEPEITAVLDKLCRGEHGRLLRAVPPPAGEPEAVRYELYHDVLGEPIFEWRRHYEHGRQRRATIRRFAVASGVLVALVAAFAALGIWALVQRSEANRAANSASSLGLTAAANAQLATHPNESLLLGFEAVRAKSTPQARRIMIAALEKSSDVSVEQNLGTDSNSIINNLAFSPDGHTLATAEVGHMPSFGARGGTTIGLWDPVYTYRQFAILPFSPRYLCMGVAFSRDGRMLASVGCDGTVRLWDTRTDRQIKVYHLHAGRINDVDFSPDGHTLAFAGQDGTVRLWDARTYARLAVLPFAGPRDSYGDSTTLTVRFSPDGNTLAVAGAGGAIRLLDAHSHRQLAMFSGSKAAVVEVRFSPDGRLLASGSRDGTARLWDTRTHRQLAVTKSFRSGAETWIDMAFSPDGHTLATVSGGNALRLWDTRTHRVAIFRGDRKLLVVAFSPDGHTLAVGGGNPVHLNGAVLQLRNIRPQPVLLRGHTGPVYGVAFSPDGHTLASASEDATVRLWDAHGNEPPSVLPGHTGSVYGVAFSPDGHTLASVSDAALKLWDTHSHRPTTLHRNTTGIVSIAFSPDGHTVATGGEDTSVRLWDARSHGQVAVLPGHTDRVNSLAFNPDGKILASASNDGTVRLWDTGTRKSIAVLKIGCGPVHGVAFSPDGHTLALACDDGTVQLWDARSHLRLVVLPGHTGSVSSVAFSPDGQTLASAGADSTVRLWDTRSHSQLGVIHTAVAANSVAFSPDGDSVAFAGADGTVQVWQGILWHDLADLKRQVCSLVVGNLPKGEWQRVAPGLPYHTTCPN
jgi:WD40 repeat protein